MSDNDTVNRVEPGTWLSWSIVSAILLSNKRREINITDDEILKLKNSNTGN